MPSNLPPDFLGCSSTGFVNLLTNSSSLVKRSSNGLGVDAVCVVDVDCGDCSFWYGETRYAIITGEPFWNDFMYITSSFKHNTTDNPVLPIGTLPNSMGELIE